MRVTPKLTKELRHPFPFVLFILISAIFATPAYASSIVVNDLGDTVTSDGKCMLREAIHNANGDSDTTSGNDGTAFRSSPQNNIGIDELLIQTK